MTNAYDNKENKNPYRIAEGLKALGIEGYNVYGEPTNEEEFNKSFEKIMGTDKDLNAITSSDPKDFGFTWAELKAEMDKL